MHCEVGAFSWDLYTTTPCCHDAYEGVAGRAWAVIKGWFAPQGAAITQRWIHKYGVYFNQDST